MLIWTNPNIKGLEIASSHHKLCLFADDALLFVTSPRITLPNWIKLLDNFASVSELEVNPFKFKALNVSLPQDEVSYLEDAFQFHWSTFSILYLGIKLRRCPSHLFWANYLPMLSYLSSLMASRYVFLGLGALRQSKLPYWQKCIFLESSQSQSHLIFVCSTELCTQIHLGNLCFPEWYSCRAPYAVI